MVQCVQNVFFSQFSILMATLPSGILMLANSPASIRCPVNFLMATLRHFM